MNNILVFTVNNDWRDLYERHPDYWADHHPCTSIQNETWKFLEIDEGYKYDGIILPNPSWCLTFRDLRERIFQESKFVHYYDRNFLHLELNPVSLYNDSAVYECIDARTRSDAYQDAEISSIKEAFAIQRDMAKYIEICKWYESIGYIREKKKVLEEWATRTKINEAECPQCGNRTYFVMRSNDDQKKLGYNYGWVECTTCGHKNWDARGHAVDGVRE